VKDRPIKAKAETIITAVTAKYQSDPWVVMWLLVATVLVKPLALSALLPILMVAQRRLEDASLPHEG
jgi:AmiR/NasT family two-component response regulator